MVSDTHVPQHVKELPVAELTKAFEGVDLILHGGDIYSLSVLDDLERIAPVLAARGDDDYGATVMDKRVMGRHSFKVGEQVIWLTHERPYIPRMAPEWWEARINPEKHEFGKPNIVVFGHLHRTVLETVDDVLYINPGSPTFLHYQQGLGTYGILEVNGSAPEAQILNLYPV
jgi:putative phosphoesterase